MAIKVRISDLVTRMYLELFADAEIALVNLNGGIGTFSQKHGMGESREI